MARESKAMGPHWTAEQIRKMELIEAGALAQKNHAAAATARNTIGRWAESAAVAAEAERIQAIEDPIERVEAMAAAALAAASYVAANQMSARAVEMRRQREEAERQRRHDELLDRADGEVMSTLVDAVRDLPSEQAAEVFRALAARPDLGGVQVEA